MHARGDGSRTLIVSLLVTPIVVLSLSGPAGALATITVTSNGDAGGACTTFPTDCTLRQAFEAASTAGPAAADDVVIVIQAGVGTILAETGTVVITDSTFSNNHATDNGTGGAVYLRNATLTVRNSTFSANSAVNGGGAIYSEGAIATTIVNSTFSGNLATDPGLGGFGGGAIVQDAGALSIVYSTFSGNRAPNGSAINSGGRAALFGTVFVKPTGTANLCDIGLAAGGTYTSSGFNFANETANSCSLTATGDPSLDANDARLGALASNGGATQTLLPQTGSPLIDRIPNASCAGGNALAGFPVTTDQHSLARPEKTGGACDVGSVEVQVQPVTLAPKFTG